MVRRVLFFVALVASQFFSGCDKKPELKKGPPPAVITTTQATTRNIQVTEETIGAVDTTSAPVVSAEVPAQVERVLVEVGDTVKTGQVLAVLNSGDLMNAQSIARAQVKSLEALVANQEKQTARTRQLAEQKFISATRLDESISQLLSLQQQLKGAQAGLDQAQRNLAKTRIHAPVSGKVEQRLVTGGDFVTPGKSLFQIATNQNLRVRLPFPESLANQLQKDLTVYLATPAAPNKTFTGKIAEIKPMIGADNRSFEAIVEVPNPGNWAPGASVNAKVVIAERPQALAVPETSVVIRPAGKVVYVIKDGKAYQRIVSTGTKTAGLIEITSGLSPGEIIAVDGAGFLTDKADVRIQTARP